MAGHEHHTGKLSMTSKDIGKQAKQHKELKKLQNLRDTIAELRLRSSAQHHRRRQSQPLRNHAVLE